MLFVLSKESDMLIQFLIFLKNINFRVRIKTFFINIL